VRGLAPGAPVDFRGIDIGTVTAIKVEINEETKRINIVVEVNLYPARLRTRSVTARKELSLHEREAMLDSMVAHGLRGQLRTGNLLTGQLYVALDFIPGPPRTASIGADGIVRMPTAPGTLSELQPQIAEIVQKVSKIPFDAIGRDLRTTLARTSAAIGQLTPEAQKALAEVQRTLAQATTTLDKLDRNVSDPNAPVQRNLEDTLLELQRTARALRVLSDYLQQHPESLLRGKPADTPVPQR